MPQTCQYTEDCYNQTETHLKGKSDLAVLLSKRNQQLEVQTAAPFSEYSQEIHSRLSLDIFRFPSETVRATNSHFPRDVCDAPVTNGEREAAPSLLTLLR